MRTSTDDMTTVTTKNNRTALTGKCATCGIKNFRFISLDSVKDKILKQSEEVTSQPNWQSSQEPHGENTPEKSTFQDIATVAPEQD